MSDKVIDPDLGKRDILEFEIPRDVLDILLKDRTTGKNILWMTDGYEHLESIFGIKMGVHDPIDADAISRPGNKIIRPRVDKSKEEQRKRVIGKAEVFTPSWICNNMINRFDAAWFKRKTSPFTKMDTKGYPTKDGFIVMKDSVVSDHLIPSFEKQCRPNFNKRKELESSGVIVKRKFTRDYTFGSPSGASSAILGRSSNGYADWKTKGKQKLADFRE